MNTQNPVVERSRNAKHRLKTVAYFAAASLLIAGGGTALLMNRSTHPGLRKLSGDCIGCHNPVSYALAGTNAAKFSKGVHPVTPGFIPSDPSIPDTRVMTGEECSLCHADVFRTWKQANHARAFSNAIFQTAFKLKKPHGV
jgi:hypothetical protein